MFLLLTFTLGHVVIVLYSLLRYYATTVFLLLTFTLGHVVIVVIQFTTLLRYYSVLVANIYCG